MSNSITTGELIARFLESCGVQTVFGVISIHNMPILDAIAQRGRIRFVPARSEQGAANMADANARVHGGIGVVISSTGTAAGNTCGSMVEALTAGTPLLHITGQIEREWLDRQWAFIHEARDQLDMMGAVSKRAWRVWSPETALGIFREAVRTACSAPSGPVAIEIPIDVQAASLPCPADLSPLPVPPVPVDEAALDRLAGLLATKRRPLLWLGGGARGASTQVAELVAMGFGVVTSVQGRGIIDERHPMSLGAYNLYPESEAFYQRCDALVVVGSQLRSNETLRYALRLPRPLYRIDADASKAGRAYVSDEFITGDAALALEGLAQRLRGRMTIDADFAADLAATREAAGKRIAGGLGPYAGLVDAIDAAVARRPSLWVRDVTVSNSTWGNRAIRLAGPRDGVHALGGGIGMGIQMALGAALAAPDRKTLCLSGDGGLMVNIGELATLAQEHADVVIFLMNDRGYGVIRNIQDAQYGGRRHYVDLHTPDFEALAGSLGLGYRAIRSADRFAATVDEVLSLAGPILVEIDMNAIGPYAATFAGPPVKKSP
jgi:acetolactate synthase-1/2/3 large subunit